MSVFLVNPSDNSFGTAVITPRWLFVLAAATPVFPGDPILVDESLEQIEPERMQAGDIVGISVHTGNALRGYADTRLGALRGRAAPGLCTEESTQRCFLKRRWNSGRRTRS